MTQNTQAFTCTMGLTMRCSSADAALLRWARDLLEPLLIQTDEPPRLLLDFQRLPGPLQGVRPYLHHDPGGWDAAFWGSRVSIRLGDPVRVVVRLAPVDPLVLHLALQNTLYLAAPRLGGVLLHAAGLVVGGRAIVLSGDKDAGKTTACRNAPRGAQVLSDESVLLTPAGGGRGWLAHGTLFCSDGYSFSPRPGHHPVQALVLMARGAPRLEPLPPYQSAWSLMRTSARLGGSTAGELLALYTGLAEQVPGHRLSSDRPEQVWPLLEPILHTPAEPPLEGGPRAVPVS